MPNVPFPSIVQQQVIVLSNVLDFVLRHELEENVLVSENFKSWWVDLWCESNILQRQEKCQFYAFGVLVPDQAEYFMAPN